MPGKFNNIFLIGPMGSGKSTIGRELAEQSKRPFFDSDTEIVERSGVEISWIFEQEGETGFRKREQEMIKKLSRKKQAIIATGGGCVTNPNNLPLLSHNGIVVYLQVSIDVQLQRISKNKAKRPVFASNDSRDKLIKLNEQRQPLYESIADLSYCTDNLSPKAIAAKILLDCQALK